MNVVQYNDIRAPLPPGWEDGTQVVLLRQQDLGGFRANIVMSSESLGEGESVDAFVLRAIPSLRASLTGYTLDDNQPVSYGAHVGRKLQHHFDAGGKTLKQQQFFTACGDRVYTITFTDAVENFDTTRPEAEKIIAQLTLK